MAATDIHGDPRLEQLHAWLVSQLNTQFSLETVSADASFRRYYRVILKDKTVIAVDSPPSHENNDAFVHCSQLLSQHKQRVPEIIAINEAQGFMLLSDCGDRLLLNELNSDNVNRHYLSAINSLHALQQVPCDSLPQYDRERLISEMQLFPDWLLKRHLGIDLDSDEEAKLQHIFALLADSALEQPQVFVHRDYHSRNLMLIDTFEGDDQIALIDYQDAVCGAITYDLISLLRDCYISWPESHIDGWVDAFYEPIAKQLGVDRERFQRWFDWIGIQRHLKASGIFCRLNYRDHKPAYLEDIPRTLSYIEQVVQKYEELQPLLHIVRRVENKMDTEL